MRPFSLLLAAGIVSMSMLMQAADQPTTAAKPPVAKVQPVTDTLHGVKITDNYRYLEDGTNPETRRYVEEQLAFTRGVLDKLPGRDKIHARLSQLLQIGSIGVPQAGGEWYFYTRREGNQNQPIVYVRQGLNGKDRILIDVNMMAADGTVALDWWYPTHDGKYVAFGTSPSGSEMSTLRVIETATGKLLADAIDRTRAASVAWKPDNSGFYYTRYPKKGSVPAGMEMYGRKVYYHTLGGDPEKDPLIFGENLAPQDWPNVNLSEDGRWLVIGVSQGWAKSELWLKDTTSKKEAVAVARGKNFLYDGHVFKGTLYVHTNEDAPRYHVFAVQATDPKREKWEEIIPQTDAVLNGVSVVGGQLLASYERNALPELKLLHLNGKKLANIPLPALGSVFGFGGKWDSTEIFFGFNSYTIPPTIYRAELGTIIKPTRWAKVDAPVDPSPYDVKQVWYTSKDGTKVPMFVVARKDIKLDGHNPTLLTGYGGFNVSMTPGFSRGLYLWLEHGGVFAMANLRGGAEFGEDWHRAGMLANKQNVFDDFIAAGEYLVAQKYTDKNHLAIQGGSNGGLLIGAAITQRPDLFRVAICQVPLLDMLRYQNFQIAKLWVPEYGSAENADDFKWLYAYSPYHHVKPGTVYPATLFMTADTDTRVDPMHAKKMAALMQAEAANGPDRPILLRIETKAGHGAGKPVAKIVEESTDVYSFLFSQFGMQP